MQYPKTGTFVLGLRIIDKRYFIIRCSSHRRHGIKKSLQPFFVHSLFRVEITCKLNYAHTTDKDVHCSTVSNTQTKTVSALDRSDDEAMSPMRRLRERERAGQDSMGGDTT